MGEVSTKSLMYKLSDQFKDMTNALNVVQSNQDDMKRELHEIGDKINDPETGIIVSTNKNTDFRKSLQMQEREDRLFREDQARRLDELSSWKSIIDRAMWTVFTIVAGIIAKLTFFD